MILQKKLKGENIFYKNGRLIKNIETTKIYYKRKFPISPENVALLDKKNTKRRN